MIAELENDIRTESAIGSEFLSYELVDSKDLSRPSSSINIWNPSLDETSVSLGSNDLP